MKLSRNFVRSLKLMKTCWTLKREKYMILMASMDPRRILLGIMIFRKLTIFLRIFSARTHLNTRMMDFSVAFSGEEKVVKAERLMEVSVVWVFLLLCLITMISLKEYSETQDLARAQAIQVVAWADSEVWGAWEVFRNQ